MKVEKCSSSELQKWNAPANISRITPISDVQECDPKRVVTDPKSCYYDPKAK